MPFSFVIGLLRRLKFYRRLSTSHIDHSPDDRTPSGAIENISNDDLRRLNALLPWRCFTIDSQGRRFGDSAWADKRAAPQKIPDHRIVLLDQFFGLADKSVLEIGCFEGVHTIGLTQLSSQVRAIDARIENVVKTLVRSNMFGYKPDVELLDIEHHQQFDRLGKADVIHHVGVLYHLRDPASHLLALGNKAKLGILLDTHYATPAMANKTFQSGDDSFRYFEYREGGREEVFSGMYDHAKWLLLDDIQSILVRAGFTEIRITSNERQRNGPRVTLYAGRPDTMISGWKAPS